MVGVPGGSRVVVANGRLIGPFDADESFALEDFALLEKHSATAVTDKITELIKGTSNVNAMDWFCFQISSFFLLQPLLTDCTFFFRLLRRLKFLK